MPENDSFIATMSGVRLVRLMAELAGLPKQQALERAHEAFVYVGLGEARYRNLGTYSLGMKQMAKLAQAIVHGPELLFLDEPTNGLDPLGAPAHAPADSGDSRPGRHPHDAVSHLLRDVEETCDEVRDSQRRPDCHHCDLEDERRSNRRFVELESPAPMAPSPAALEQLGCGVAVGGGDGWRIVLPAGVEIGALWRAGGGQNVLVPETCRTGATRSKRSS